jgi:acyl carrier protein
MSAPNRESVQTEFIELIQPYIRAKNGGPITETTHLITDLNVNSARLVDIILETEDRFHIRIDDQAADRLQTVGDAVDVILERCARAAGV